MGVDFSLIFFIKAINIHMLVALEGNLQLSPLLKQRVTKGGLFVRCKGTTDSSTVKNFY